MRAARVDANQTAIVKALRSAGAQVILTHTLGSGFPDVIVNYSGCTAFVEIKDGQKSPSERRLTPDQLVFHAAWQGTTLAIVCDVESALRVLATMKAST